MRLLRQSQAWVATGMFAVLFPAPPAQAHTILLSRGSAVVHDDRVSVELEIGGEDFLHLYRIRATADGYYASDVRAAAERHRDRLLERFILRDAAGNRLGGQVNGMQFEAGGSERVGFSELKRLTAKYSLEFPLPSPPRFLTFQQAIADENAAGPSQLVLSVMSAGDVTERLVQLTSRGNAETVEFGLPSMQIADVRNGGCPAGRDECRAFFASAERFTAIQAAVRSDAEELVLTVSMPLTTLTTFMPLPRREVDFLHADEAKTVAQQFRELVASRIKLRAADALVAQQLGRVVFLAPADEVLPPDGFDAGNVAVPDRLGFWSGRVALSLRYPIPPSAPFQVHLEWDLFSPEALNATIWRLDSAGAGQEHVLMPGSAILSWTHGGNLRTSGPVSAVQP